MDVLNKFSFPGIVLILTIITCSEPPQNPNTVPNSPNRSNYLTETCVFNDGITEADFTLLFIGNSLTYFNDLPALVRTEAKKKGLDVCTKMMAFSNYAIVDHWADGKVQNLIKTKNYDFVILQQGPSSQPEGRDMLLDGGKLYSELCNNHDAQLAYFMVWPSINYFHTFDGVIANYTNAAESNNAILCPVGSYWKQYIDRNNDYSYYGSDGFHPSLSGSEVAARVIVSSLFQ